MTRTCSVCGAVIATSSRHRHELKGWAPRYDDLEGALEGYETVDAQALAINQKQSSQ